MKPYTICKNCPCLNNDYENGADCNLGYETELVFINKETKEIIPDEEARAKHSDHELIYISFDCYLEIIQFGTAEVFIPETVRREGK